MADDVIFMRNKDGLVELPSTSYDAEEILQELLEKYPQLLAGFQMNRGDPRRFLLVKREAPVADWSLDHLFIDQSSIPTLVEVKRSSDTRIRREVVGQMLDYAANGSRYWGDNLQQLFEQTCEKNKADSGKVLSGVIGEDTDAAEFWENAERNLSAGFLRLVFVADVIPDELRAIIEFLNAQMTNTEVYGVEVRRYGTAKSNECFVPRLIGASVAAEKEKGKVVSLEERFRNASPEVREVREKMRALAEDLGISAVPSAATLLLKDGLGTIVSVFPKEGLLYFQLSVLREVGQDDEAENFRSKIAKIAGKPVTPKEPGLSCAAALAQWDKVCDIISELIEIRQSISDLQSRSL